VGLRLDAGHADAFPGATLRQLPRRLSLQRRLVHPGRVQDLCAPTNPATGLGVFFWHPQLVTMHVGSGTRTRTGSTTRRNAFVHPFTRHGDLFAGGSGEMADMANMPGMTN